MGACLFRPSLYGLLLIVFKQILLIAMLILADIISNVSRLEASVPQGPSASWSVGARRLSYS